MLLLGSGLASLAGFRRSLRRGPVKHRTRNTAGINQLPNEG
ncbi:MAG: hypothetical protein JXL84_26455 [Deltaproteobacteria bacterium]|nr:hypothetical protein [Deltaproteobacteria bacterium]